MKSTTCLAILILAVNAHAAIAAVIPVRHVILDTDIGDDIDDAFALALILQSPSLHLDAISVSFGDTTLRALLVRHFLHAAGRDGIPLYAGPATRPGTPFTQSDWAGHEPMPPGGFPDAVDGLLDRLRRAPDHSITLIALAPTTTIGAMIARDPITFRRLAMVAIMGGSIDHGYGIVAGTTSATPSVEYTVRSDPVGWRRLPPTTG